MLPAESTRLQQPKLKRGKKHVLSAGHMAFPLLFWEQTMKQQKNMESKETRSLSKGERPYNSWQTSTSFLPAQLSQKRAPPLYFLKHGLGSIPVQALN